MEHRDAVALIRAGVESPGGTWADLGAGGGTFTRALADLLGPGGTVYALDRDPRAVRRLRDLAAAGVGVTIVPVQADLAGPLELPVLDGALAANALHFLRNPAGALGRVAGLLKPGGHLLVVEYEGRRANPWVPHPLPLERFAPLAAEAGLSAPEVIGRRPSRFGGELYAALARKPG